MGPSVTAIHGDVGARRGLAGSGWLRLLSAFRQTARHRRRASLSTQRRLSASETSTESAAPDEQLERDLSRRSAALGMRHHRAFYHCLLPRPAGRFRAQPRGSAGTGGSAARRRISPPLPLAVYPRIARRQQLSYRGRGAFAQPDIWRGRVAARPSLCRFRERRNGDLGRGALGPVGRAAVASAARRDRFPPRSPGRDRRSRSAPTRRAAPGFS